jgi:hypothetical protein
VWLNVGSGPHRAPPPWWNVDVAYEPELGIVPDQIVELDDPLPFADGDVERAYVGHLLEHLEWARVPDYLAELGRVLAQGAPLVVVGPDVERALQRWKRGLEPWEVVDGCLEGPDSALGAWAGCRHCWNCTEARVARALELVGFEAVTPLELGAPELDEWPVVSRAEWQCAVSAVRP